MNENQANNMIARKFNGQRRLRSWSNTHYGGMEAVKATPLAICRFNPDEGGTVRTDLNVMLAPVSGYMRSKAYVDVTQVFVPYQAIEKLELDEQEDAGVTEMTRRRLMAGQGIGLEQRNVISDAANVHPKQTGDVRKVSKSVRLAYLCAVNHMRKVAYYAASQVPKTETAILPAVLTANVLERFNGVLDPERHIDGAINLTGELPVKGLVMSDTGTGVSTRNNTLETGEDEPQSTTGWRVGDGAGINKLMVESIDTEDGRRPNVRVGMEGAAELTLRDMVESQKLDAIIRNFAKMIQDDPINGEEQVERALYGISVDYDHNCQVLYRKVHEVSAAHVRPTDGASVNDVSGHFELDTGFATLVPRSELGGQLVTLVSVKPLETVVRQPDPIQTESWALVNRVQDETQLDEVLVKRSDIETDMESTDTDTPVFWCGHNALKHEYSTQGPNERLIPETELRSSMWTYEIPTSVTPGNVSYPADGVEMYPFFNHNGAHADFTIRQQAAISTTLAKGPTPIERIHLFEDEPGLITG